MIIIECFASLFTILAQWYFAKGDARTGVKLALTGQCFWLEFIFGFGFDTPIHYGLIPADLTIGAIHLRAFIRQWTYFGAKRN
tara:strand:+ start:452 stop:700 length:249 start_codon:yes stop_codon:yes gene_type:complete